MLNTYQFSFPVNKFPHSSTSNIITFSHTHTEGEREGEGGGERGGRRGREEEKEKERREGGREPKQTVLDLCRKIMEAAGVLLAWGSD